MQEIKSEALKEPERSWREIVEEAQNEPGQIKLLTEIAKSGSNNLDWECWIKCASLLTIP